jgi:restriction system protein
MSPAAFQKFHELMRPMLEQVTDGQQHSLNEVNQRMSEHSGLTPEQLAETIPSGMESYRNRSFWAATYLRKAAALSTLKRGWVQLTERGRQLLAEPGPVTVARLKQFPCWEEAWGHEAKQNNQDHDDGSVAVDEDATPEEQIATGISQLQADVRGELLMRVKSIPPSAFETLVLPLLSALGNGVGP